MIFRQFAAMNMIYQRHSFSYFLDSMERMGLSNFELWTGAPHLNCCINSQSDAKAVRRLVDVRGLKMVCVTPEQVVYPYNIAASNAELRSISLDYFHKYIDMTAEMGVERMLCCSGWGDYDMPVEEAWKRAIDGLESMVEHAARVGIDLAFEVLQPFESNLCNSLTSTKRMMDTITHPNFRLCVDTVPVRAEGKTLDDYFREFGSRICHIHLTDGNPSGHVPYGLGNAPVEEHLAQLEQQEYSGFITLEIGDTGWADKPEEATKLGFATLEKYPQYIMR